MQSSIVKIIHNFYLLKCMLHINFQRFTQIKNQKSKIKNLLGCLFIISMLCYPLGAQHLNPSDIRISLLTAAPGNELFLRFGHSAIRIRIDSQNYDTVYNYGTFDFNAPNFYGNFARGRMLYFLGKESYHHFVASYMYENRRIREQVFDLDSAQTMFVLNFLENNALPENCYYRYHFLYDNCATRIRDLMLQTFSGTALPESQETPTFRDLIHRCTREHPWGKFGIDIALGLPTDRKTGTFEQMFLPDDMFDAFAKMSYHNRPIVKETNDIFIPDCPAFLPPGFMTPMVVCCLVLVLALVFSFQFCLRRGLRRSVFSFQFSRANQKNKKNQKNHINHINHSFDFLLFLVVGLVGLLVIFLWFFTDHTNTQNNLNIIWALPTHAVMAFFLLSKQRNNFTRKYFLATSILAALLLVTWAFLPQPLNPSLIPLVLAVALRALLIYRK